jgi:hypothetical protein
MTATPFITDCVLLVKPGREPGTDRYMAGLFFGDSPTHGLGFAFVPAFDAPVELIAEISAKLEGLVNFPKIDPSERDGAAEGWHVYWREFAQLRGLTTNSVCVKGSIERVSAESFDHLLAATLSRNMTEPVELADSGFNISF